jgi:hypothetical protein
VLISSTFTSTAAWHTDQLDKVADLATELFSTRASHQNHPAAHSDSTANAAHPNDPGNPHIDHKSVKEDNKTTQRASHSPNRVHGRRAHRKTSGATQRSDKESMKPASNIPAPSAQVVPHFLAILSDALPEGLQTSPNQGDRESASLPPQAPSSSNTPGAANLNIQVKRMSLQEKLGAIKTESRLTSETASVEAAGATSKSDVAVPQDSSLEITKQLNSSDMKSALSEKPAEHGEMAFAVRVSERATLAAALNLNDVQAAIAASRFDASGAGSHPDSRQHSEPPAAQPIQKGTQTSSATDATAEPSTLPGSSMSADSSAQQLAGAQDLSARPTFMSGNARSASAISSAVTAAASPSTGGAQPQAAGMNAPGTPSAATPESRNPGAAKSSESRTPQFLDAQDEKAGGASASVRDISLKLTSKDQAPVQVRLSERAGELHVSVRTPDAGLTRGLRDGLSDLVGHLEHNGYRAESWQPGGNGSSSAHDQAQDSPSHNSSSQQQNGGGSGSGSRQQQNARDHQEPETQTPKWVGELESSLQRSLRSWPPSATR